MKSGLQALDEKLAIVDQMLREDYGEGIWNLSTRDPDYF